ncbi:hypothetical protein [Tellurirhabdus rosea]|uniref:hypothetical protein n=1 Tax=Tellurirhabdus rosea TaxID=2674997 RepID=UPI002250CE0B|nr:hypothetical protein [Tellurirhabdus rosea]
MKIFQTLIAYLKGSAEHLGTTKNLMREVLVAVLTAVCTYMALQLLKPAEANPVHELREVLHQTMDVQREKDSLRWADERAGLKETIDSLKHENNLLLLRDSLRANAALSDLDAARAINRAIEAAKKR